MPIYGDPEQVDELPSGAAVRGGYQLLATQNDIPFHAYCQFRLAAEPLEPPTIGFGYRARGIALHTAAEKLYAACVTDASMHACLAEFGDASILAVVKDAFARFRGHNDAVLHRLLDSEERRASAVLAGLIAADKQRKDFRIQGLEVALVFELGGLLLSLRIDRIDQVDDGLVIIDYKTARQLQPKRRQTGLPGELQLAVYALALRQRQPQTPLRALTAMKLHTLGVEYSGIDFDAALEDVGGLVAVPDRASELDDWSEALTPLATAFRHGDLRLPAHGSAEDHLPYAAVFATPYRVVSDD